VRKIIRRSGAEGAGARVGGDEAATASFGNALRYTKPTAPAKSGSCTALPGR
jgi:hypothetical protein